MMMITLSDVKSNNSSKFPDDGDDAQFHTSTMQIYSSIFPTTCIIPHLCCQDRYLVRYVYL